MVVAKCDRCTLRKRAGIRRECKGAIAEVRRVLARVDMRQLDACLYDVAARFVDCPRRPVDEAQMSLVDLEREAGRTELHTRIRVLRSVHELVLVMQPV